MHNFICYGVNSHNKDSINEVNCAWFNFTNISLCVFGV